MEHSVDKEVAEWSHSKSCGQRLDVKVERPVRSGIAEGSISGPVLFNIFVGCMDVGIECPLSKFADDSKVCGGVDVLEGRDAIQRDLERLERWACVNLVKFSKATGKVLHLCRGNPKQKYRLGGE